MRSRAQFKAHPVHPTLVPFPFAFLIGALGFDLLARVLDAPALRAVGGYLTIAGIAAGIVAAIPGAIDYAGTVPPRSSARTRALKHAAANVTALLLFAAAFALRDPQWGPTGGAIVLEAIGAAALVYAGWEGGVLVTRNLIGVDHRYADAGKWREAWPAPGPDGSVDAGHIDDLKENQMLLLHVNGERVVLARTARGYCAFEDRCPHRGGSLAGGVLAGGAVQCLWHGSQFDAETGRVICGPATSPIATFPVFQTAAGRLILTLRK